MTTPSPRIATLVVDDPRGALPAIEVESPWWMESGPVVDAARTEFGVDVRVVRLLDGDEFPGGPVSYLVEAPDVDRALLRAWSAPLLPDPNRAHYAEVGAVGELIEWIDDALSDSDLERSGPVEQVRTWNLSCLLRVPITSGRPLWLKAVPDFFRHEPAVLATLAAADPSLVPELVAARPGVSLMAESGNRDGYGVGPDRLLSAVERFVAARRVCDPAGLTSVPTFGSADARLALGDLLDRHAPELDVDECAKLRSLIDEVDDRWDATGAADTLTHGDLHGGNLRLDDDNVGADVIVDWGDATISHPLLDLAVLDSYTPDWGPEVAERWLGLLELSVGAWTAFRPLAALRLAVVYRSFCDRIEASEQIYHRGDIVPAIRRGLRFVT